LSLIQGASEIQGRVYRAEPVARSNFYPCRHQAGHHIPHTRKALRPNPGYQRTPSLRTVACRRPAVVSGALTFNVFIVTSSRHRTLCVGCGSLVGRDAALNGGISTIANSVLRGGLGERYPTDDWLQRIWCCARSWADYRDPQRAGRCSDSRRAAESCCSKYRDESGGLSGTGCSCPRDRLPPGMFGPASAARYGYRRCGGNRRPRG